MPLGCVILEGGSNVVWERGCTPRAPAVERRGHHRFHQRKKQKTCSAGKYVAGVRVWASSLGLRADDIRKACLSFPSKTAIGLDQHAFTDIALLPDNVLESVGEIIRQCFVKFGHTNSVTFATVGLVGQEKWREQNHRHLAHSISPHHALVSAHMVMSSLQVSGTLRSRLTQRSEHMLRGQWASSWPTMRVNM